MAIAASMQVTNVQAQIKSVSAAKSAVEKTEAATTNPKQSAKVATWTKYGQALIDANGAAAGNVWIGMTAQELQVIAGSEKPSSTAEVEVGGQKMTKQTFDNKNLYFNEAGKLAIIEVTKPVVDNSLDKAVSAFQQANKLDEGGKKSKDIAAAFETISTKFSDDAYTAYSLGKTSDASVLFEKAARAAAEAPLNKIDTNAIYNAGFTAWMSGENERAKGFFEEGIAKGYAGENGESYAKLADICTKLGKADESKGYLEQGFKLYPQSQSILVGLINYYVTSGENTDRLFELLDEAKKNEPTNASLYYVEGNIRSKLGQFDEAVAAYDKCSVIDPKYAYGYIGKGILFYDHAVDLQTKASSETDDAKYMALMGEFEKSLKDCIEPFEKAFDMTKEADVQASIAEYLKNACYRFRMEDASYQAKYDKYAAIVTK